MFENLDFSSLQDQEFIIRFRAPRPSGDLGDIALDELRLSGIQLVSEESQFVYRDQDNDGYGSNIDSIRHCSIEAPEGYSLIKGDCNDENEFINPSIPESECNGIDDNCNLLIDEDSNSSLSFALDCLLYTSPSPRDQRGSRMPSSA